MQHWPHLYQLKLSELREQIADMRRLLQPHVWSKSTPASDDQFAALCFALESMISEVEEGYDPRVNDLCPSRYPDKIRIEREGDE